VSIVRIGMSEDDKFGDGYDAIFGKKTTSGTGKADKKPAAKKTAPDKATAKKKPTAKKLAKKKS
jgi:hypothetical protein